MSLRQIFVLIKKWHIMTLGKQLFSINCSKVRQKSLNDTLIETDLHWQSTSRIRTQGLPINNQNQLSLWDLRLWFVLEKRKPNWFPAAVRALPSRRGLNPAPTNWRPGGSPSAAALTSKSLNLISWVCRLLSWMGEECAQKRQIACGSKKGWEASSKSKVVEFSSV